VTRQVYDRLTDPDGVLSRIDLTGLGWPRRAVDAIFRACDVVVLPGYSRPMIRVRDYLAHIEAHTYRGDRVRPTR
jgi:hypothetical protein